MTCSQCGALFTREDERAHQRNVTHPVFGDRVRANPLCQGCIRQNNRPHHRAVLAGKQIMVIAFIKQMESHPDWGRDELRGWLASLEEQLEAEAKA
jgi:hypothetical protein